MAAIATGLLAIRHRTSPLEGHWYVYPTFLDEGATEHDLKTQGTFLDFLPDGTGQEARFNPLSGVGAHRFKWHTDGQYVVLSTTLDINGSLYGNRYAWSVSDDGQILTLIDPDNRRATFIHP